MMKLTVRFSTKTGDRPARELYRKVLGKLSAHGFMVRPGDFVFAEDGCPLLKSIELIKTRFFGLGAPVLVRMVFDDTEKPQVTLVFCSEKDSAADYWADVLHGTLIGPMANLSVY